MEIYLAYSLTLLSIVTTIGIVILSYKIFDTLKRLDAVIDNVSPTIKNFHDSSYLLRRSTVQLLQATTKITTYAVYAAKPLLGIASVFSALKNTIREDRAK